MNARVALGIIVVLVVVVAAALILGGGGGAPEGTATTTTQPPSTAPTTATTTPAGGATETTTTTTTAPPGETTTETQTEQPGEGIVLYVLTRHPGDIRVKTKELFLQSDVAKQYGITDIVFVPLDPASWIPTIENRAGTDQAIDVAWGGGPTLFDELYLAGLLSPLEGEGLEDALAQIPDYFAGSPLKRVGDDGKVYWAAAAIASFGFTVNHKMLDYFGLPTPQSWRDLASPTFGMPLIYFGQPAVGVADPTVSTSNTRMYEIILQRYGWEEGWKILTGMAANSKIYPGSGDVRDAVIRGEIAVGITIDFYGYTAHLINPDCEYILPQGESIVNGDPIALVKTSRHPEAAKAFIRWILTEGQVIWLDKNINRLPANPRVFETPEGQQRQDLKQVYEQLQHAQAMKFNDSLALSYEAAMRLYFKAFLVEQHPKLVEVWTRLLELLDAGAITEDQFNEYWARLAAPLTYTDPIDGQQHTFTQDDAIRVTSILHENPQASSQYLLAWKQAAEERLNQLLAELGG